VPSADGRSSRPPAARTERAAHSQRETSHARTRTVVCGLAESQRQWTEVVRQRKVNGTIVDECLNARGTATALRPAPASRSPRRDSSLPRCPTLGPSRSCIMQAGPSFSGVPPRSLWCRTPSDKREAPRPGRRSVCAHRRHRGVFTELHLEPSKASAGLRRASVGVVPRVRSHATEDLTGRRARASSSAHGLECQSRHDFAFECRASNAQSMPRFSAHQLSAARVPL
jgi:hypothetical protein